MNFVVDTHVLIWRFLDPKKLSKRLKTLFASEENEFWVPNMALMETQYLNEIGRIQINIDEFIAILRDHPQFRLLSFDEQVLAHALRLSSNRDPFDRIILAHALASSTPILTRDRWMKRMAPHLVVF